MIDITHKPTTLRQATACAYVTVSRPETIAAIQADQVPKGNVFEMAKTAGLFAVKKTSDMIPDCHPLPVESTQVRFAIEELSIRIEVDVRTIYRTGVEVEAVHGASVIAVTMYDMLKPIDPEIEIRSIRLLNKKGGKSDFQDRFREDLRAAVVVCSDSISAGKKTDRAGKAIVDKLEACAVNIMDYVIIPDEVEDIQAKAGYYCAEGADMIIFTGGTGLSPRDVTPEALAPLLDRVIPGIAEAVRNHGQDRIPYSMLSRSVAGLRGNTLILALPGSTNGARESMEALFPAILHIFRILKGARHN